MEKADKTHNKIRISVDREHYEYLDDVLKCFSGLNVEVTGPYIRKSLGDLPMQVIVDLAKNVMGNAAYDLLKKSLFKVISKFKQKEDISVLIRDSNGILFNINKSGNINVITLPEQMYKFKNIKNIDDLFDYLKRNVQSDTETMEQKNKTKNIPKGWRWVKFSDFCEITRGGSPRPIHNYISQKGTPWVKISDATSANSRYITKTKEFIKPEGESKSRIVYPGDLIVSNSATPGLPKFLKIRACIHDGWLLLRNFNDVDKEFLYYLILVERNAIVKQGSGTIFTNLKTDILKNHRVLLPPLPEQKAIAEVLSSLDDKIELLHKQNKTLEDMAQALFRKWFVDNPERERWEKVRLGGVVEILDNKRIPLSRLQRDKMKRGKLYPYYGAAQIMDWVNNYIFDGEYILLAEDGTVKTKEGYPVLQYAIGRFWVNNHTHVLKAKKPYHNFFIYHFLLKMNVNTVITGAVQPKINQTNLKSLPFPQFPVELVMKFQNNLAPTFQKVLINNSQIRTLGKLRDTLLPKLMSGKVRVKM